MLSKNRNIYPSWSDGEFRLMRQGGRLRLWQPRLSAFLEFEHPLDQLLIAINGQRSIKDILQECGDGDIEREALRCIQVLAERGYVSINKEPPKKQCIPDVQTVDDDFTLKTMIFHVTDKCNLHCSDCYLSSIQVLPDEPITHPLTTCQITSAIEQFACLGGIFLVLSGGEPTMRDDIVDIARLGRELKLRVSLITNGTLLTPSLLRECSSVFHQISVSIDGMEESHQKMRGGNFRTVVSAIEHIKAASIDVGVTTVITKENRHELPHLLDLLLKLGVSQWNLTLLRAAGRAAKEIPHCPDAPKRYLDEELMSLAEKLENVPMDVVVDESLMSPAMRTELGVFARQEEYARWHNTMTVMPDGRVVTCVFYPELCYGDITRQNIKDIYYAPLRGKMMGVSKMNPCDKCPLAIIG